MASFDKFYASNFTEGANLVTGAEYQQQKAIYASGMQILFDFITDDIGAHRRTQRALIIVVIVTVCIMIPIVLVMSAFSIYIESAMKKEIAFVSELLLLDTLHNNVIAKAFEEYCQKERSEEHMHCWREIENYKKLCGIDDDAKCKEKAQVMLLFSFAAFLTNCSEYLGALCKK